MLQLRYRWQLLFAGFAALALLPGAGAVRGQTSDPALLQVKEPEQTKSIQPRTPERQRWSWNQAQAEGYRQ